MFRGPIYVIGMPRSGTKLLRDLLNQHPQVNIPEVETHFIPLFVRKYGIDVSFDPELIDRLFANFYQTSFYWNIERQQGDRREDFEAHKDEIKNWNDFVTLVFSFFGPKGRTSGTIFGDKTPGYVNHVKLLKEISSEAKFIHIVRDPRDYCWSVKNIWNKNMLRASLKWQRTLETLEKEDITHDDSNYIEVTYEQLLDDVEGTMKSLSDFLGIDYINEMTTLSRTAENYGDAKGKTEILKSNSGKFAKRLSKSQIHKIEEIAFVQMIRFGYKPLHAKKSLKPSKIKIKFWEVYDAFNSLWFHIKEKGLIKGTSYFFKLHNQSSWRVHE